MANSNKTQLDANQCAVNAYDGVQEAVRSIIASPVDVNIVNSVEYSIELNAADGDSVSTYPVTLTSSSVTHSNGSQPSLTISNTGIYSKFVVYSSVADSPVTTGSVKIQGSHSDSGNNWHDLTPTIIAGSSPQGVVGTNGASVVYDFIAKRLRLVSVISPSSSSTTYTIMLRT